MTKETAFELFKFFESVTYEFEDAWADTEDWEDENTPVAHLPFYDVRFDASTDSKEDREYRIRITLAAGSPVDSRAESLQAIAEAAKEHGVGVAIQNNGIELS